MTITGSEFVELTEGVELAYQQAEDEIILDITKRLAKNKGMTATAEWQMEKLAEMGGLQMSTIKTISKASGVAQTEITKAVTKITKTSVKEIDSLLKNKMTSGTTGVIVPSSDRVAGIVGAITQNAKNIGNITNATLLNNAVDAYKNIVNNVGLDIQKEMNTMLMETAVGARTIADAVTKEVRHLAENGIAGFTDKAGRMWQADTYMTMVARTSVSNAYLTGQRQRAEDYGVETFQIVPHYGARPLCAPYQGHYFSWDGSSGKVHDLYGNAYNYDSIYNTSYGQPAGIFGINCRHTIRVCADGLFVPRDEPFNKAEQKKNEEVYENLQKQRYYEREVRKAKREALCMKEIGDEEGLSKAMINLKRKRNYMVDFCAQKGLTVRDYRTGVFGYTREVSSFGRKTLNNYLKVLTKTDPKKYDKITEKLTGVVGEKKKQIARLTQKLIDMGNPVYRGIWEDDVTLEDWSAKKNAIKAKEGYLKAQLEKYPDDPTWQGLLDELHDFDAKGKAYWDLKDQSYRIEYSLTKTSNGATRFIADGMSYPQDRLDKAYWNTDPMVSDKLLRGKSGEVWRASSQEEKLSLYEYSYIYDRVNAPLRGIEYGTGRFVGRDNIDLDMIGVDFLGYRKGEIHRTIDNMTAIIDRSYYDFDIWLQRGCRIDGMDAFFGVNKEAFNLPVEQLAEMLVGNEYTEPAFMSCGSTKDYGFTGDEYPIIMRVFAPKGTKMMYLEPISKKGEGINPPFWDGLSGQDTISKEAEVLVQRGTRMLCSGVTMEKGKICLDMEIVGQGY